jgi:DedD protein
VERHVKERLVGAAVLTAAAVILIPEMLSGPKRRETAQAPVEQEGSFKTYTIDFDRSPGSQQPAPVTVIEESAPPPEEAPRDVSPTRVANAGNTRDASTPNADQASPESRASEPAAPAPTTSRPAETQPVRAPAQTQTQPQSRPSNSPAPGSPAPSTTPVSTPNRTPSAAPKPAVPAASGWAVQVGSFSNRATAERLMKDFTGSGHAAFVMPVQSGGNTLYRVRIGPYAQRAAADAALPAIKKRVATAVVVAHP